MGLKGDCFFFGVEAFSHPPWCFLPPGFVKLNFDVHMVGDPGPAAVGGLLQNRKGSIILSFQEWQAIVPLTKQMWKLYSQAFVKPVPLTFNAS